MKYLILSLFLISALCDLEAQKQTQSLIPESQKNDIFLPTAGKDPIRVSFSDHANSINIDGHLIKNNRGQFDNRRKLTLSNRRYYSSKRVNRYASTQQVLGKEGNYYWIDPTDNSQHVISDPSAIYTNPNDNFKYIDIADAQVLTTGFVPVITEDNGAFTINDKDGNIYPYNPDTQIITKDGLTWKLDIDGNLQPYTETQTFSEQQPFVPIVTENNGVYSITDVNGITYPYDPTTQIVTKDGSSWKLDINGNLQPYTENQTFSEPQPFVPVVTENNGVYSITDVNGITYPYDPTTQIVTKDGSSWKLDINGNLQPYSEAPLILGQETSTQSTVCYPTDAQIIAYFDSQYPDKSLLEKDISETSAAVNNLKDLIGGGIYQLSVETLAALMPSLYNLQKLQQTFNCGQPARHLSPRIRRRAAAQSRFVKIRNLNALHAANRRMHATVVRMRRSKLAQRRNRFANRRSVRHARRYLRNVPYGNAVYRPEFVRRQVGGPVRRIAHRVYRPAVGHRKVFVNRLHRYV